MNIRKVTSRNGKIKWEVRFYVNGRGSKRVCKRFDIKADAQAYFEQKLTERRGRNLFDSGIKSFEETTFRQEAEHWLRIRGTIFSPGQLVRAKHALGKVLPKYGKLSPNRFHPGLLTQIQSELLSSGIKPATVNRDLQSVKAVLSFSTKQRRIPFNPTAGFEKLPEVGANANFWEREEAQSFLAFTDRKYSFGTKKRWIYVVYLLALNTGLRAGETWGLQPQDVKQDGEVLHIQRQFDLVKREFRSTKGKESRCVPCNDLLRKELDALVAENRISLKRSIFRTMNGTPICHRNFIKRMFEIDVREWRGKRIRFHDLRHTAITLMIGDGLDVKTVQEIAGHKDVKTTMNYVHLLAERIRYAAKTFAVKPEVKFKEKRQKSFLRLVKC